MYLRLITPNVQLKNGKQIELPKTIETKDGCADKICIFCATCGDSGQGYYWSSPNNCQSGNFDVTVASRQFSIMGAEHPRYAKFSVSVPKGHDKPPESILDIIEAEWRKQAGVELVQKKRKQRKQLAEQHYI